MGLFSKKDKNQDGNQKAVESVVQENTGSVASSLNSSSRPKKRSELLSSVLDESVDSSSLKLIRDNEWFRLADIDRRHHAFVLTVYADDIGGLNAHMKGDEDKGQFLRQIKNDLIHVHVNEEMLAKGKFVLIPDQDTLVNTDEYAFLADPSRFSNFIPTVVSWDDSGEMEFEEFSGEGRPLDWVKAVSSDSKKEIEEYRDLLQDYMEEDDRNSEDPASDVDEDGISDEGTEDEYEEYQADDGYPDEYDDLPSDNAPMPPMEETGYSDGELDDMTVTENDYTDTVSGPEAVLPADGFVACPACGQLMPKDGPCPACGYGQHVTEEADEVALLDAVSYTFYRGDLDLEVTAELFDIQFMSKNSFDPIEDDRGDGWLNGYASQLAKDANAELKALHNKNLLQLRNAFLKSINIACSDIAKNVSVSGNTVYAQQMLEVEQAYEDSMSAAGEEVEKKQAEMQKRWDQEREEAASAAAARARKEYQDRYGRSHENSLQAVMSDMQNQYQADRDQSIRQINDARREEAGRQLTVAIQKALVAATEKHEAMLEEEQKVREQKVAAIKIYIDKHMQDEIARVDAETRRLDEAQQLKDMEQQMVSRLSSQSVEHEAVVSKMAAEITASNQHAKTVKQECDARMEEADRRERESKEEMRDILHKFSCVEEDVYARVSREYEERLHSMEQQVAAAEAHSRYVDESNRKHSGLVTVAWVAMCVTMLLVGTVLGGQLLAGRTPSNWTLRVESPADNTSDVPVNNG